MVARASSHDASALVVLDGKSTLAAALSSGELVVAPPRQRASFWRVGLRYDATGGDPMLELSVERSGSWGDWMRAPVTFESGEIRNAHLELDAPAERVRLRPAPGAMGQLRFLAVELFEHELVKSAALDLAPEPEGIASTSLAIAPASLVHPRSDWGAAPTPDCGALHTPTHLTIHHTVTPNDDPTPPAERIKGIQSYHINSNGWCDIGYHFLISQDGDRWQGWKDEQKVGIHTGGNNTNNVGISFLGSYHLAEPPLAQLQGAMPLVKWMADTYGIVLDRDHVLGHGEWPGQSTQCPGSFLLARLQEIIDGAKLGDTENHVSITTEWRTIAGQERDFVAGSSGGIFDALVGQTLEGEIVVRNGSARPATDAVLVGYFLESPYLAPLSYTIEHDLPAKDGASFVTSPADSNPNNPPKSGLGSEGVIDVGVIEPGESVRIVLSVRAEAYSFGAADHPDLRAWVKHVGDYYGEQDGWDDVVEVNLAGKQLQSYAQSDVFSGEEWRFDGPAGDDIEGWTAGNQLSDLAVNLVDHALAMKASGEDPFALSPGWTSIDADSKKEIHLRARQHGGPRDAKLYFKRTGEDWSEDRQLAFTTSGGGTWDEVVLDLSTHPEWTGTVVGLRIDSWEGPSADGPEAWFDIDWIAAGGEIVPPGSGGSAGWGSGGSSNASGGGSGQSTRVTDDDDGGCGCAVPGETPRGAPALALCALFMASCARRRARAAILRDR